LADVSTVEEAAAAEKLGADLVAPTLAGYTPYSPMPDDPLRVLRDMVAAVQIPVIAEGHVSTPQQARLALEAGAWAVVVGSAITRPQIITARFVQAIRQGGQ
jgi:N-acylglucosamine-6-phosphate 2-epimerase